jgi:AraC-like DNA-binding protein
MRGRERCVLTASVLARTNEFELRDVRCASQRSSWSAPEESTAFAVVLARRGCFRRRVRRVESVVDPTVAYFVRPGEEQQIEHPSDGGDACTAIGLAPELLATLWGGDPRLPVTPVFTTARLDLEHRLLVTAASRGTDETDVSERVLSLVAGLLGRADQRRVESGRPATRAGRRRVVEAAREALAVNPTVGLPGLARQVAVSPYHLSRIFHEHTGETVTRYRNRLRVRVALERLAEGEPSLARLAADLGFADQAHLARVTREELGFPPSQLRSALSATDDT